MLVFFFSLQKHCEGNCFFFPFNSLDIMRYASKACSSCRAVLMLISTEGSEWYICIYWATPRICETAQYESAKSEGCVYVCVWWDGRCLLQICLINIKTIKLAALKPETAAETDEMPDLHCHFHTSWSAVYPVKMYLDSLCRVTLV